MTHTDDPIDLSQHGGGPDDPGTGQRHLDTDVARWRLEGFAGGVGLLVGDLPVTPAARLQHVP